MSALGRGLKPRSAIFPGELGVRELDAKRGLVVLGRIDATHVRG